MPRSGDTKKKGVCSFCGKAQGESGVRRLFLGEDGNRICDQCVQWCYDVMQDELYDERESSYGADETINLIKPMEMKAFLDQYVVGQDEAKKTLSVAVYNHYKRVLAQRNLDVELQKSNILMIGPTGSGKTYLAQTLARILNVPFAIADATALTEAGYVGEDVENILLKLIQAAEFDIERAEYGIIYIDEIDKITRKSENTSITRDVSGEGVQQGLLKILEGTDASVPPQGGRKHPQQEMYHINTTNILFICGGAFDGLEKIVEQRTSEKSMGFGAALMDKKEQNIGDLFRQALPQDLVKFGLIPEFVGRVPVTVALDQLDEDALVQILTTPKNALAKQYQTMFELDGVKLEFEPEALLEVARRSFERKTGARGLRAIMESIMLDSMYEIPSMEDVATVVVTKAAAEGKEKPLLVRDPSAQSGKIGKKSNTSDVIA